LPPEARNLLASLGGRQKLGRLPTKISNDLIKRLVRKLPPKVWGLRSKPLAAEGQGRSGGVAPSTRRFLRFFHNNSVFLGMFIGLKFCFKTSS